MGKALLLRPMAGMSYRTLPSDLVNLSKAAIALVAKDMMIHEPVSQGRPHPNVMVRYQVRIESNDDPCFTPSTISIKCMNTQSAEVLSPNYKRLERRIVLERDGRDEYEYEYSLALILIIFQLWMARHSSDGFSQCRYKGGNT
jgi:hypothetical protein